MSPRRLNGLPRAARWSFLLACVAQAAAFFAWGNPELLHDEADYLSQATLFASWLSGQGETTAAEALGRLALHNPGYSLLVALTEASSLQTVLVLRLLQIAAGLMTGLVVYVALAGRVGSRLALCVAWVIWLHPTLVFFRLTLWPVTLAVLGTSLAAAEALRISNKAGSEPTGWILPLILAVLPFFSASGWLFLPLAFVVFGRARALRMCSPAIALWCIWTLVLSFGLGSPATTDLSASRNLVLANHPAISEGRGSLWGDPAQKAIYLADLEANCASRNLREEKRCEHNYNLDLALRHVAEKPWSAVVRAGHRLTETWQSDRFLLRHLDELDEVEDVTGHLAKLLVPLHWVILVLSLLGLRTAQGRAALLAVVVWTAPVFLTVGFTRLRQPMLPLLLIAAAFGIYSLRRTNHDGD